MVVFYVNILRLIYFLIVGKNAIGKNAIGKNAIGKNEHKRIEREDPPPPPVLDLTLFPPPYFRPLFRCKLKVTQFVVQQFHEKNRYVQKNEGGGGHIDPPPPHTHTHTGVNRVKGC